MLRLGRHRLVAPLGSSHHRIRRSRPHGSAAIKTDRENIVTLTTSWEQQYQVTQNGDDPLGKYLREAVQFIPRYRMPPGASICATSHPEHFELCVARLSFMDVHVQPKARVKVIPTSKGLSIVSEDCIIGASEQIKQLGLEDRFEVDVLVDLQSAADQQLHAKADMTLLVDLPHPFNMTPVGVFEAGGNLVVSAMMEMMMSTFMRSVVSDYERWTAGDLEAAVQK